MGSRNILSPVRRKKFFLSPLRFDYTHRPVFDPEAQTRREPVEGGEDFRQRRIHLWRKGEGAVTFTNKRSN